MYMFENYDPTGIHPNKRNGNVYNNVLQTGNACHWFVSISWTSVIPPNSPSEM